MNIVFMDDGKSLQHLRQKVEDVKIASVQTVNDFARISGKNDVAAVIIDMDNITEERMEAVWYECSAIDVIPTLIAIADSDKDTMEKWGNIFDFYYSKGNGSASVTLQQIKNEIIKAEEKEEPLWTAEDFFMPQKTQYINQMKGKQ